MKRAVAKEADRVTGTDVHVVLVPASGPPVPVPTPLPFAGVIDGSLSADVYAENRPVGLDGSTATNTPAHVAPAGTFQTPPANRAVIQVASRTVYANNRRLARADDPALTCSDPTDALTGTVVASGTVLVGD